MNNFKLIVFLTCFFILNGCSTHKKSFLRNKPWFEGKWTGVGFQIDLEHDNTWDIELEIDAKKEIYTISYPSLNCSGKFILIKHSKEQATFKEVIEKITIDCVKEGIVILSKIDDNLTLYSYFYKDGKKASAFSTLEKK